MKKSKLKWIPRILTIMFILFISLFALDAFSGDAPFLMKLGGFMIHMIPSFILVVILIISWKRQIIGGVAFIITGVLFAFFFNTYEHIINFFAISFPLFLTGSLFILFSYTERNEK